MAFSLNNVLKCLNNLHLWIRIFLFIIILFLSSTNTKASYDDAPTAIDGNSAGIANASVMRSNIWSSFNNQAGLGFLNHIAFGGLYAKRFSMDQLGTSAIAAAIPVNPGTIGTNFSYYGFNEYNESIIGLAYGIKISKYFSAGVQLDYLRTYIAENYNNRGSLAVEGGIMAIPVDNLFIGFHVFNPSQTQVSPKHGENIPTVFRLGIGYRFFNTTLIALETEKDIDLSPEYKIGIEHYTFNSFYLRGGISTRSVGSFAPEYAFGFGFEFNHIEADIAFANHLQLGFTPHLSLCYILNRNEADD